MSKMRWVTGRSAAEEEEEADMARPRQPRPERCCWGRRRKRVRCRRDGTGGAGSGGGRFVIMSSSGQKKSVSLLGLFMCGTFWVLF